MCRVPARQTQLGAERRVDVLVDPRDAGVIDVHDDAVVHQQRGQTVTDYQEVTDPLLVEHLEVWMVVERVRVLEAGGEGGGARGVQGVEVPAA